MLHTARIWISSFLFFFYLKIPCNQKCKNEKKYYIFLKEFTSNTFQKIKIVNLVTNLKLMTFLLTPELDKGVQPIFEMRWYFFNSMFVLNQNRAKLYNIPTVTKLHTLSYVRQNRKDKVEFLSLRITFLIVF